MKIAQVLGRLQPPGQPQVILSPPSSRILCGSLRFIPTQISPTQKQTRLPASHPGYLSPLKRRERENPQSHARTPNLCREAPVRAGPRVSREQVLMLAILED